MLLRFIGLPITNRPGQQLITKDRSNPLWKIRIQKMSSQLLYLVLNFDKFLYASNKEENILLKIIFKNQQT